MTTNFSGPASTQDVLKHLRPGKRFAGASFSSYRANLDFPSQAQAAQKVQDFAQSSGKPAKALFWRKAAPGRGLYLDGGFGVGKTHLLASAYAVAAPRCPAAYVHFQELTSLIGRLGMEQAVQVFSGLRLLCIDEFELDDPGNLHLLGTFLGQVMVAGVNVVTTSNTPPDALGQGRFNAALFSETLSTLAGRFEAVTIDGPDYRRREHPRQELLSDAEYAAWLGIYSARPLLRLTAAELDDFLLRVHPAGFGEVLAGVEGVSVTGLQTFTHPNKMLREQGAIRFVHFVDKVYDLGLPAAFTGVPVAELFEETYRTAAFGRKYSRCLSRVAELTAEAAAVQGS